MTSTSVPDNSTSLLLEIGTEEVPARFLPKALDDIRTIAARLFEEYRIPFGGMISYATPRRIALHVDGVSRSQGDSVKEVFGPAKKAGYDEKGNPTKAAVGFAGSVGIPVADLKIRTKGKGEYLVAIVEEKGIETARVLPELLSRIIHALHFPKSMRWGDGSFSFVRPIQWILAVMDGEKVSFEIDGIRSNTITKGHRFLAPAGFQIKEPGTYINLLEKNFVIADQDKRKETIRKSMLALFSGGDLQPLIDEELLDTVTFLVEYPVPVLCSFSTEYLKLPKELLLTVMKDHQKYFGVQNENGDLANNFIVTSNTKSDNAETVRVGAERVIKARFDDAKFYFSEDRKRPLADRVEELKAVTFQERLGTLFDKTGRIARNAEFLAEHLNPDLREKTVRAARLAKTDLITGVVREFPELQGIMGKYYAYHDKEDSEVAEAIEEQYLPRNFGDRIPATDTGAFVSLADRIDNIASFFSIGLIPSGSEDPFSLRRQAMGIVSILLDRGYPISLASLFRNAIEMLGAEDPHSIYEQVRGFLEQRIEFVLSSRGYAQPMIKAVIGESFELPLSAVVQRIEALARFSTDPVYPDFLLAIKRVNNITPKETLPPANQSLLVQDEERSLAASFAVANGDYAARIEKADYDGALLILSSLTGQINLFFDKVLVMDKDEKIRLNRLSLLQALWSAASRIADFSKLQ